MLDLERFAVFTIAAFVLFLIVVLWVIRNRITKPRRWSVAMLAVIVVPLGMIFARYSHIFFHDLSWTIYYGVPALTTFILPPLWLQMSRREVAWYVPMALFMAPIIHVMFSLFAGWHDYMPFPVYIPSLAELVRHFRG
jgi:hypothetical protein